MEAKPDLKKMSTQKKLEYIWDYYKFHIMGIIVLAITLLSIIHHYATLKHSVLDMLFLNAHSVEEEANPFEEFLIVQGFNLKKQEIRVTTSLGFALDEDGYQQDFYSMQTLSALFGAGDLDVFAAPHQVYDDFASSGYVLDLRSVFTEDELNAFGEQVIYTTLQETGETFPSGFNLDGNRWLLDNGYYDDGCYLAIATTTDTPELTKEFLLYILNY